jgi:hypothetical protein
VVFRSYFSRRPVDGGPQLRPAILSPVAVRLDGIVPSYQAALAAADVDAAVGAFADDGYLRESFGPQPTHRGSTELRAFFEQCLRGGGVEMAVCAATDDGVRCAVEYNCLRLAGHVVPPQAALVVYERDADGLLSAVRMYDDVFPLSVLPRPDPGL